MDDDTQRAVNLALAQAKRVNRESRLLVQSLAKLRDGETPGIVEDNPQPKEAQENHEHRSST